MSSDTANTTTSPTTSKGRSFLAKKLITKEDPHYLHKGFAICVLLSYIWRFTRPLEDDMGFKSHPYLTFPTLLLHLGLNLSSFIFRIPAKRHNSTGGMIWQEYRLHSIIFLLRSSLAIVIRYAYNVLEIFDDSLFYNLNFGLVLLAMACADWASWSCGEHSSNSIRGLKDTPTIARFYFSFMQFIGTAMIMTVKKSAIPFMYMFVVQINPFGMTLVRKNVIKNSTNVILYAAELSLVLLLALREAKDNPYYMLPSILAFTAALLRFGFGLDKYLIWIGMSALFQTIIRPVLEAPEGVYNEDGKFTEKCAWLVHFAHIELFVLLGFVANKHIRSGETNECKKVQ